MERKRYRAAVLSLILAVLLALSGCGLDTRALGNNVSTAVDKTEEADASDDVAGDPADDPDAPEESASAGLSGPEAFYAAIPEWNGVPFYYVDENVPSFTEDQIWTSTQEQLDDLDELGCCGTALSCIGQDGMPTEPRGNISEIHPTGWDYNQRYEFVEGGLLFNRCHLIAHQLSGDDAIPRNLITGTSYMNRQGMLPFEEAIGNYVRGTGNHVMYSVTPVFLGDELVARGVHMEAVSVEDGGEGISFNVFCYNVQPGIEIDYQTGENHLADPDASLTLEDSFYYGPIVFAGLASNESVGGDPGTRSFVAETDEDTETAKAGDYAEETGEPEAEPEAEAPAEDPNVRTYILNTNTKKFHYPTCKSVKQMKDKNKQEIEATREEVIEMGYDPCGNCHP